MKRLNLILTFLAFNSFCQQPKQAAAQPQKPPEDDNKLLIDAVKSGNVDALKNLFSKASTPNIIKANANFKDATGTPAIIIAIERGDTEIVNQLILQGADPNIKDSSGLTPLMHAVKKNNKNIVELLHNADKTIKNSANQTAWDLIKDKKLPIAALVKT